MTARGKPKLPLHVSAPPRALVSSMTGRDDAKQQQVSIQCPAASSSSTRLRAPNRAKACRLTKKESPEVPVRRHPTRRHPKHFAEPSGGPLSTLRTHDPEIWLNLGCAEGHRSSCAGAPIASHTSPYCHGSATAPTQMRPNGTSPRRPLAWRRAAPRRHPACDLQDGAAGAHIRRSADNNRAPAPPNEFSFLL